MDIRQPARIEIINYKSNAQIYAAIYKFMERTDVYNAEINMIMGRGYKLGAQFYSFSKKPSSGYKPIPREEEWEEYITDSNLEGVMCLAGTNKTDTRRVTFGRMQGQPECAMCVLFHNNGGDLNPLEKDILRWLKDYSKTH